MKNQNRYNIGDIILDMHVHDCYDIGLITETDKRISIRWGDSSEEMSYSTTTIDKWIKTNNAKHYQVVE